MFFLEMNASDFYIIFTLQYSGSDLLFLEKSKTKKANIL